MYFFNKTNSISVICLGFILVNLITLGIQAKLIKYHLNIKLALVRFLFYFIFFCLICLITFKKK